MDTETLMGDIPLELANAAHAGTSMVPEERAHQERAGYARMLATDYENLLKYADTDDKRALLAEEFARYREGYAKRYRAYLGSRARIVSWMVAGPANFPTRRMEKRNRVSEARLKDLVDFRERALKAIRRVMQPELRPVMAGDADAVARLEEKIEKAEATQERMKTANAAIRKASKGGAEAQTAALEALGFSKGAAHSLLTPDYGPAGFPAWELTNNAANIRRMRERLENLRAAKAAPETSTEGENGVRLEDCPAENRVRLFFPSKPSAQIRAALKANGFRWAPSLGCWQGYRNTRTLEYASRVTKNMSPETDH